MRLNDLIKRLNDNNIHISLTGDDQLKVTAAKGAMTPELMQLMKAHKAALLSFAKEIAAQQIKRIQPRAHNNPSVLSSSQQRLWFTEQLAPGTATYHVPLALRIQGYFDLQIFQQTINQLIVRHESLRTAFFIDDNGTAMQQVLDDCKLSIEHQPSLLESNDEKAITGLAFSLLNQPFDLSQAPLMRVNVISFKSPNDHLVLINLHHLITDGWSNQILLREIAQIYLQLFNADFDDHQAPALPPVAVQYADYAEWQQSLQKKPQHQEKSLHFWREQLTSCETLNLPFDRQRPASKSGQGKTYHWDLPEPIHQRLKQLANAHQCSNFVVYLALYQLFLHKLSQQHDIVIGIPTANRTAPEVQQTVGFFVNTLALRAQIDSNTSFDTCIDEANALMLKTTEHQDTPFETLVDALTVDRDRSVTPLFQVMLAYQNQPPLAAQEQLNIEPLMLEHGTAKFDLTLGVDDQAEHCSLSFEYDCDLFNADTLVHFAECFDTLTEQLCEQPTAPIHQLSLLNKAQKQRIKTLACGEEILTETATLAKRFSQITKTYANKNAIVFNDETLTYTQLDTLSDNFAYSFQQAGISPEQGIILNLTRSVDMLICTLACCKLGSFYVPLDPSYPEQRQQYIITDSGAVLVISKDELPFATDVPVLTLNALKQKATHAQPFTPVISQAHTNTNNTAYMIYTSGSTGKPKGVPISHANLLRLVDDHKSFDFGADKRIMHLSNVAFDAAIWEVFGALLNGSTLIGISQDNLLDVDKFSACIQTHKVTHVLMTVALFNLIADLKPNAFTGVEFLGIGGEAPSVNQCLKVFEYSRPKRFVNLYGPAENTVVSAFRDITLEDMQHGQIPIGRPVANTCCYVVDEQMNLCPFGITGQLALSGAGLSAGYHNLDNKTADVFIENPFRGIDDPYPTLYLAGDRASIDQQGIFHIKGRTDDQIKLRGFRIELAEILQAVTHHRDVRDAVVDLKQGDNPYLAAYIVPENPSDSTLLTRLKNDLTQTLPHYMLPKAYALIDQVPLTPNGKVDKNALGEAQVIQTTAYKAPETPIEKQVAESFRHILHVDSPVSLYDDFFSLGGQSLLATRVIANLRQQLHLDIQLRDLFDHPTVELLANFLQHLHAEGRTLSKTQLIERPDLLPLSYAQQRLWFIEKLNPGSLYHMPFALKIEGELDVLALDGAFRAVILRHESLRTGFMTGNDKTKPYQVISPDTDFTLETETFIGTELDLLAPIQQFIEAPFNLAEGHLLRARLYRQQAGKSKHFLVLSLHHIIADGWSIEILLRDLFMFYQQILGRALLAPTPLPLQYADFTLLQNKKLADTQETQLHYWQQALQNCPTLSLPTDFIRPAQLDAQGAEHRFRLPKILTDKIRHIGTEQGASLFMTLSSAFTLLLSRYSQQDDITIGTPIANRSDDQLEDVIGLFLNTLVLRNQIHPDYSFIDLLQQVKANTLSAFQHQDLPFDWLVDELGVKRDVSQTPVFQAMIILQTAADRANQTLLQGQLGDLTLSAIEGSERLQSAKFDITLNVIDLDDQLEMALEYRTSLFKSNTIERMAQHLVQLLIHITQAPDALLADHNMITKKETAFFLGSPDDSGSPDGPYLSDSPYSSGRPYSSDSPNATQVDYPKIQAIHHMFEHHAAQTPGAIALSDERGDLTYGELNGLANQLATEIRALNLSVPRVGLSLYRSRYMSIGLLGILKAGAAYVPLDPDLPQERFDFVTSDASLALILTDTQTNISANCLVWQIDTLATTDNTQDISIPFADDALVNIIYTSGSTGQPKGVKVPHQGIINRLQWMQAEYPLTPSDKVLQKTPFTFDVSVWELLWPLITGASLVFAKKEGHQDPHYLAHIINTEQITCCHFVPSMLAVFLQQKALKPLPTLKQIFTSGEALPPSLVTACLTQLPNTQLDNLYGPTEASIDVTYAPCRDKNPSIVPIGKPIANTQILILDNALNLCPLGIAGEIYIGGRNLALGYVNREALTAKTFIDNPFPTINSQKLYKTGDLGRYLDDGQIQYLGRNDFQVKIRGQRIELGDIESHITHLEGVQEAVVIAENINDETALIAYYTGEATHTIDLHKALANQLPHFMLPQYWQHLAQMPLSANGKIDRKALPDIEQIGGGLQERFTAADTALEKTLCTLFGDTLAISEPLTHIGIDDDFFLIGGHSLKAISLTARIENALDVNLPVSDIFLYPTVRALSLHIEATGSIADDLGKIVPVDHSQPILASFNQQRLWLFQSIHPESSAYHMPMAFDIHGALDAEIIQQALNQLVKHHSILRTRLFEKDGVLYQQIESSLTLPFSQHHAANRDDALALAQAEMIKPFALTEVGCFRAGVINIEEQTDKRALFYLVLHHSIADALSLEVLLEDWFIFATAISKNTQATLSPQPLAYADFAHWQQTHQAAFEKQLDYWENQLQGANSELGVLNDLLHDNEVSIESSAGTLIQPFDSALVDKLRIEARTQKITPFMLMFGAMNLLLSKTSQQDHVTVGVPVAGRHRHGLERVAGFFINTLLLQQPVDNQLSVSDFFADVKQRIMGAFAHQDVSIEQVLARLQHTQGINDIPTRIGFNYFTHEHSQQTVRLNDAELIPVEMPATDSKYDLVFSFQDTKQGITLTLEYNATRYAAVKIQALTDRFIHVLNQLMENPDAAIAAITLFDQSELLSQYQSDNNRCEQVLQLSPVQRDIYLDSEINSDNPRNYLGWLQHLDPRVDVNITHLQQALALTIQGHNALRMRILGNTALFSHAAYQLIKPAVLATEESPLRIVDLADASDEALIAYAKDQVYQGYPQGGPLFELVLITRNAGNAAILLRAHHACLDGISLNAVTESYSHYYQQLSAFPDMPDFEANEQDNYCEYIQGAAANDSLSNKHYWQEALKGFSPLTPPQGLSNEGLSDKGFVEYSLNDHAEHYHQIKAFCKTHKTTPSLYIKALYSLLLNSYCFAEDDFFFHEVLAARPAGHSQTVGCYFSNLPVLVPVSCVNDGSISDLLMHFRSQQKASRHTLGLSNSAQQALSTSSTCQFLYNFYTLPNSIDFEHRAAPLTFIAPVMDNAVNLTVRVADDHLRFHFSFDKAFFTDCQFLQRLLHLSQQILAGETQLNRLSLLLPDEKPQLPIKRDYPVQSVLDALIPAISRFGQKIAVIDKATQLSFHQLDQQANQLAHRLLNAGVNKNDSVGLHLEASCSYMVALLAVLKIGANYVAIDTKYPIERKQFIADDAELACVMSEDKTLFATPVINTQNLTESTEAPNHQTQLSDTLYTIYTSGSTGQPKGARITQANFLNLLLWYQAQFTIDDKQRILVISSVGFDLTQKNLFASLLGGATLVFQDMAIYDPAAIIRTIDQQKITLINAAPSACYPLFDQPDQFTALSSLQCLLLGGEAIHSAQLKNWFSNPHNQASIVNMYGPSECTDIATYHIIDSPEQLVDPIPLGVAPPFVSLNIADAAGRILPRGLAGEMLIAGAGLGLGYTGHAHNHNAAFFNQPQTGNAYKTGDLVTSRPEQHQNNDALIFIGRKDHQIKVRGIRIEPAEISYQLNQLEGVTSSLVMINSQQQLVAYVISEALIENWREKLQDKLSAVMMPQAIHCMRSFPLSASGKVDRKQLPEITTTEGLIISPKTLTEKALLPLWQQVLNLPAVSVDANFFELGGHSLLAANLVSRIKQQLETDVSIRTLFENPSIEQLATALDRQATTPTQALLQSLTPLDRAVQNNRFALSLAQERLWLIEQIQGRTSMYNMPLAFHLKGDIDEGQISAALRQVANKHQVLYTHLEQHRDQVYQVLDTEMALLDIREKAQVPSLEQQVFNYCQKPFEINHAPLFRAQLLKTADSEAIFMVVMHHMISDGLSMMIFTQDLMSAFAGVLTVSDHALQYIDYSYHQRTWLAHNALTEQVDYWKTQLHEVPLTQLPTDRPYRATSTPDGAVHSFSLDANTAQAISAFAEKQQVSVSMLMMASFQLLLCRYSGQKDIAIGTAVANRPDPTLEAMIGFFINTLVIRNQLDTDSSFAYHVKQVREAFLSAFAHQDVPFEQLLDTLNIERDLGHSPVFQAFYSYQTQSAEALKANFNGLSINAFDFESSALPIASKFELSLHVLHTVEQQNTAHDPQAAISGSFEYRTQLFDQATIQQLADHLVTLLKAIVDKPDMPMAKLPLLLDAEQKALSTTGIAPKVSPFLSPLPALSIPSSQNAQAIAVKDTRHTLTYNEMNQRANALASHLLELGIQKGERIALLLPPSTDFIVALLGVIQSGACYIPLDTELPKARQALILDDAQCRLVITQHSLADKVDDTPLLLDRIDLSEATTSHLPTLLPDDTLYMIYTSGSTGTPKGVEVLHRGENNLLAWYTQAFGFTRTHHKCLVLSSLAFDLTQKNFFAPLITGGELHFTEAGRFDPVQVVTQIKADNITLINCAPSHFYGLLEVSKANAYADLASLTHILLGGEPIQNERVQAFFEAQPHCELINMYGPTECTDIATYHRVKPAEFAHTLPIGQAIPGVDLFVLDEHQELLPQGAIGELYIGGAGLAKGYFNQKALTQARFIWHDKLNARLYRTGDLVAWNRQQQLVFHGRTDHQVKIRGFRIELADIEHHLQTLDGVKQAVVQALIAPNTEQTTLVAYAAIEQGLEADQINKHLHKHLADYMVPEKLILLSEMPLNNNGKVDRNALPAPEWSHQSQDLIAPSNDYQARVLAIWQNALQQQCISVDDNFFAIGGHSLKAAQIVARIREQFAVDINLRELFTNDTIEKQAALIEQKIDAPMQIPLLTKAADNAPKVLSYAQQRLWLLTKLAPNNVAYNMPAAWVIRGEIDTNALTLALKTVIARHDSLRTVFTTKSGEPAVEILSPDQSPITLQHTQAKSRNIAEHQATVNAAEPFALDSGQLLRVQLLSVDNGTHILSMNMHHIISDGWSVQVLLKELFAFYQSYQQGTICPLPEPRVQYSDYAIWQRNWLQGDTLDNEIAWWKTRLAGVAECLPMPLDHPRPEVQQFKGKEVRRLLDTRLTHALTKRAKDENITPFMLMLAAYHLLLKKFSQHDDIAIGIPLAGRNLEGLDNVIGFFINALVIRADLSSNLQLHEFLQSIKSNVLAAFAHEHVPIEMLMNALGIERHLNYTPVVQCAFNMMTADESTTDNTAFNDLTIEPLANENLVAKFDLQLNVLQKETQQKEDGWLISLEYNSDIFDASTIHLLLDHYETLLSYFCYQPATTFDSIQLNDIDKNHWLPLTAMQRDIYLASLARPDTLENSLGYAMRLPIKVNIDDWQQCVTDIHRRFVSLNARIVKGTQTYEEIAYLALDSSLSLDYDYQDLSNQPMADSEQQDLLKSFVLKPYDLTKPLVGYRLIKFGENDYWFTFACHHLVSDGFSGVIHLQLMTMLYENKVKGTETLFSVQDHFKTYAKDNRAQFDRPETLLFWQEQLKNCQPLEVFIPDNAQAKGEQKLLSLPVPQSHVSAVKTYCRQHKITPALYFKCLYALMIKAYTRAEGDFVITEFNAGRDKITKDTMGCFYHNQPSRFSYESLRGDLAVLFKAARAQQKLTKPYLQISNLKLKQWLPESRIGFSYNYLMLPHSYPMLDMDFTGNRYTPNAYGMVDFRVQADGDDLCLWLAFNDDIFYDNDFLARFLSLSAQCIEGIDHCNQLNLRLPEDKTLEQAPVKTDSPCVLARFAAQVKRTPSAIAVSDAEHSLSYKQLDQRTNQVAHYLIAQGIKTNDHVAVCLPTSTDVAIAIWGTLKAGACYVPIDSTYPQARIDHIREDASASVSLTPDTLALTREYSKKAPIKAVNEEDLFYTLYTSGSTGLPKGASVTHANERNLIHWYTENYQISAADKVLVISSIGFDLTQKNLIAPLCAGAELVFYDAPYFDPSDILSRIEKHCISLINCAPSALYALIEAKSGASPLSEHLRLILLGGESIQWQRIKPLVQQTAFHADIVNMYGPTECTDIATAKTYTAAQLKAHDDDSPFIFALGEPITGVSLQILDDQHQALPDGFMGELAISGDSVGAGYWQRPELNQQAFIAINNGDNDSASGNRSDKVSDKTYLTGDLVYRDNTQADNPLIYVGRKDFQVKLNGRRIELGEIETAINILDGIDDSRVLVINDALVAFAIPSKNAENIGIESTWQTQLARQLPLFMQPKRLHFIKAFPLSANGKVDRKVLAQQDKIMPISVDAEPATQTEKALSALWQDVLGQKVSTQDNFFSAGGDSLSAVKLIAKIEFKFEIKLPVASLFNAQTIEQQAQLIEQEQQDFSPIVCINKGNKSQTPLFAIHALGGMVLSYQPLAQAFDNKQPFYGVQAFGFDDDQTPFRDLHSMVDYYTDAIIATHQGEYRLIGHSVGGIIALEIARKLKAQGKTVSYLGLIDTHQPLRYLNIPVDNAYILKTFVEHNFGKVDLPLSALRVLSEDKMIEKVVTGLNGTVTESFIRSAIAVIRGFQSQMVGYKAKPLDVPLHLFRPLEVTEGFGSSIKKKLFKEKADTLGFHKISPDFTLHKVPGDHFTMLSQYAKEIAEHIDLHQ